MLECAGINTGQRPNAPTRMRAASSPIAIGTALLFAASTAHAIGFGQISNATQLGQPLNFSAAVHLDGDDALPRECVFAEVLSGDNKLQPAQIRVSLEGPPDAADRSVRVTTSALIDEPVVTVSVTLGCTAKVTRRFVAFIDPPLVNLAQAATPQTADTPVQRTESPMASIVAQAQRDSAAPAPRAAERAPVPPRPRARAPVAPRAPVRPASDIKVAEAPAAKPASPRASTAVSRQSAAPRPVPTGPRLQLEAPPAVVKRSASSPVTTAVTAPAAVAVAVAAAASEAASASAPADAVARERERFQALEDGLTRLRNESQATRQTLASLQARLKEAESERYANPLVYGLAWLSALLALAVAALWWRQSRGRHATQWWAAPVAESVPAPSPTRVGPAPVSAAMPLSLDSTRSGAFDVSTVTEDDDLAAQRTAAAAVPASGFVPTMPTPVEPEPVRELSVEELIDLEQQAEFFIVLGQDDAAIDLLMSHVRSDGGNSPLPYLKLLEIYRRRGEHDAYERIRERFNRRFNAYAPDWESDLQHGRSLAEYPDTMLRLEALWSTPSRVMETVDASLFRRNRSDETFDLPAYRELLFLYSIARDLAEHGGAAPTGSVDVLLPLDDADAEEPIARLVATTGPGPLDHTAGMTMPLDLDVSLSPAHELPRRDERAQPAPRRGADQPAEGGLSFVEFGLGEAVKPPKPGPSGSR